MLDPVDRLRKSTYSSKEQKALKQELHEELISAKAEVQGINDRLKDTKQDFSQSPFQKGEGQKVAEAIAQIPLDALDGKNKKHPNILFSYINQAAEEVDQPRYLLITNYSGRIPVLQKDLLFLRNQLASAFEEWINPSGAKPLKPLQAFQFEYTLGDTSTRWAFKINPEASRFFQSLSYPLPSRTPLPVELKLLHESADTHAALRSLQNAGQRMEKWLNDEIVRTVADLREKFPDKSPNEIGRTLFPQLGSKLESTDIIEIALLLVIFQQQENSPVRAFEPDRLAEAVLADLKRYYDENSFKGRPAPYAIAVLEQTVLCTLKVPSAPLGRELSFHEVQERDALAPNEPNIVLSVKSDEASVLKSVKKAQEAINAKFLAKSEALRAAFDGVSKPKDALTKFHNYSWEDLAVYCVIREKDFSPNHSD